MFNSLLQAFDSLFLLPRLQSLEMGPIVGPSVDAAHLGMVLGSLQQLTSLELDFEWCACRSATTFLTSRCIVWLHLEGPRRIARVQCPPNVWTRLN